MSLPSVTHSEDHSSLGDSTYDFIDDTDTESRDDNATESVASTDYNGVDEVASLADTASEDSEDEHNRCMSPIPAYVGLDEDHMSTPTLGMSKQDCLDERSFTASIEFEEPFIVGAETVAVKHTVRDYDEAQTALIAHQMNLHSPPTRMVASIRQTMAKSGLSLKSPLRILYIGSHAAKEEIIHKIASSVAASVTDKSRSASGGRSSQLFTVVPVGAFGSEKAPEIELMHSSGCQINVEDCTSAVNMRYEDEPGRPDVIKLSLEDNVTYHSVWDKSGEFIVEPAWDLPHIAIFYCAHTDTPETKRTRTFAKTFMNRHKVPSIIISHLQTVERSFGCMTLDQHALHMCLESRNFKSPRNIIHYRLPIDLASFLNIDARQMNRNLAYLTGLHEDAAEIVTTKKVRFSTADVEMAGPLASSVSFVRSRSRAQLIAALMPLAMIAMTVFFSGLLANLTLMNTRPSVIINGHSASAMPKASTTISAVTDFAVTSPLNSAPPAVSTKTIAVEPAWIKGPNSLSVIPQADVIVVKDSRKATTSVPKETTVCAAEVLDKQEVLIRIPYSSLISWLGQEAMSLDVSRGNHVVETERAYSSNDGIILRFPRKEAHGRLNISIVTSKKPKINETFEVDFGSDWAHEVEDSWAAFYDFAGKPMLDTLSHLSNITRQNALLLGQSGIDTFFEAVNSTRARTLELQKQAAGARDQAQLTFANFKSSLNSTATWIVDSAALKQRIVSFNKHIEAECQRVHIPQAISDALLKAQVESKTWWLKLAGKRVAADRYRQTAKTHIASMKKMRASARSAQGSRLEKHHVGKLSKDAKKAK